MVILMLESSVYGEDISLDKFDKLGNVIKYERSNPEEALERLKKHNPDVVIINKILMNKEAIDAAPNLKVIAEAATGYNNIDIEYAKVKGIRVANVAGYSTDSVVQHTFALLFYLYEKMRHYDEFVKDGSYANWPVFSYFNNIFYELKGKKWGIVGLGNIGSKVAKIAADFGCEVLTYSASGHKYDSPYRQVEFDELLNESDIISKPYIFFNVWLIMIFSDLQENPVLNSIHKNCITIFNLLGGLITKISKNKEFRWFVMDTFIFYCQSVLHILNSSNKEIILNQVLDKEFSKFELIPNILKLQTFLKELMSLEGMSNLSKRTQMIAEILILIASIDKKVKQIKEEEININKENIVDNKEKIKNKFLLQKLDKNSLKYKEIYGENKKGELQNFIYDLLLTTKIMKNFFKMDYIRYLAWKEMNPEKTLEDLLRLLSAIRRYTSTLVYSLY